MIDEQDDDILKAFTGLEGGVVASGSTCGVVSGGAMGLAISHYDEIKNLGLSIGHICICCPSFMVCILRLRQTKLVRKAG